jgi:hypothetical protein
MDRELNDLLKDNAQLLRERDEAREWVEKLRKTTQTLTCVYCGKEYPPGSPTHGAQVLTDHIKVCEKHPLRKCEEDRDKLRHALCSLVGGEDIEELKRMEAIIRMTNAPDVDKVAAINAINILIETAPSQKEKNQNGITKR